MTTTVPSIQGQIGSLQVKIEAVNLYVLGKKEATHLFFQIINTASSKKAILQPHICFILT